MLAKLPLPPSIQTFFSLLLPCFEHMGYTMRSLSYQYVHKKKTKYAVDFVED